jgi:hypothetical protein
MNGLGLPVRILGPEGALPEFDDHIALLSMPLAFGTTLETCPAAIPWLRAEPDRAVMVERSPGWTCRVAGAKLQEHDDPMSSRGLTAREMVLRLSRSTRGFRSFETLALLPAWQLGSWPSVHLPLATGECWSLLPIS